MLTLILFLIIVILPEKFRIPLVILILIFSFNVSSILPPDFWLFDNITLENLLYVYFIIFSFFYGYFRRTSLTEFGKLALQLSVFLLVLQPLYVAIKDYYYFNLEIEIVLRSIFKSLLKILIVFALIVYGLRNFANYVLVTKLIIYSAVLLSVTAFFQPAFENLGYVIQEYEHEEAAFTRMAGISSVNVNDFGVQMVLSFGALFNLYLLKKIRLFMLILFSGILISAIFFSGSRTALFTLFVISLLFLTDRRLNFKRNTIFGLVFVIITFYILLTYFGQNVISRIQENQDVEYVGLGTRMEYWYIYYTDMINNPEYFLIGNTDPPTYERNPHNYYILLLFQSGIVPLIILIYFIFKIITAYIKFKGNIKRDYPYNVVYLNLFFIILPQILYWIPGTASVFHWVIILLGLTYLPYNLKTAA